MTQVSSPRVAAHRFRTEEENEIRYNKNTIIRNLSKELELLKKQFEKDFGHQTRSSKAYIESILAKVSAFESLPWYSKLWLAILEAFGKRKPIIK